jgi:Lipocalin-like domain
LSSDPSTSGSRILFHLPAGGCAGDRTRIFIVREWRITMRNIHRVREEAVRRFLQIVKVQGAKRCGALLMILAAAGIGSSGAAALSAQEVVGTWKLLTSVRQEVASGRTVDNLGAHPNGILVITPEGRFIIIETGEGRRPAQTTEEFASLQKSEIAYAGMASFSADPQNPQALKMINHVDIAWTKNG